METGIAIIIFLVGIIVGIGIYVWRLNSMVIGTLRIVDDGQEPQPYLFVDLDVPPYIFITKDYVMMKVRPERYSQE